MDIGLSGPASGFDWGSHLEQLMEVERAPEHRLQADQSTLGLRKNAYGIIATPSSVLNNGGFASRSGEDIPKTFRR